MYEYILVEFDEIREVVIDDIASDYETGQVIELEPGTHTISLNGIKDFSPSDQNVNPSGTSSLQPEKVIFTRS